MEETVQANRPHVRDHIQDSWAEKRKKEEWPFKELERTVESRSSHTWLQDWEGIRNGPGNKQSPDMEPRDEMEIESGLSRGPEGRV